MSTLKDEGRGSSSGGSSGSQGRSVLVEIERMLGTKFRINLKEVASDSSGSGKVKVEDVNLPMHDLGRYELLGEIAEGGVGQVLRCRDIDLGREVAMKVLREKHAKDGGTIQRFVEEAQVAGQLQHPGVVPVYELGLREDRRPYFTMKFVKGLTFAAMLSDRESPLSELRRFLSMLEQICLTTAYAHAHSVIHRDLKPANILIGRYGEVQVTDWGFAKVLRSGGVHDERRASRTHSQVSIIETVRTLGEGSHSIPGSVMGTPAYMPPEQARGDVEHLDERSDVFSLGAILTEILTGAPPYVADSTERVLLKAGKGELDDAYQRLDESGADERLVKLTRMCLSPEPKGRPRNARVLAQALTTFLESTEKRRRAATVEAAKAKVQAKGDRRVRRLTLVFAVTVLVILFGGGGTFAYLTVKRAADEARMREGVTDAIARATDLAAAARGGEIPDPSKWAAAVSVAREGLALAEGRPEMAEQAGRLEKLVETYENELLETRTAAETEGRDTQMLDRLEKLRTGAGTSILYSRADQEYALLFAWYGVDLENSSAQQAAAILQESRIVKELASSLDHWALVRRQSGGDQGSGWEKLAYTALEADPDEWRKTLRSAWISNNVKQLQELSFEAENRELDPSSLSLLANALGHAGDVKRAIRLFRAGVRRNPGDFWLNNHLAFWLMQEEDWDESVRYHVAALALRPDFPGVWNNLAIVRGEIGDAAGEKEALGKAILKDKHFARAWYNLAVVHRQDGNLVDARAALYRAIGEDSEYGLAHYLLGKTLRDMGDPDGSWDALIRAAKLGVPQANREIARIYRAAGEYQKALDYLFDARRNDAKDYISLYQSALLLEAQGEPEAAIRAYEQATKINPEFSLGHQTYVAALERLKVLDEKVEDWKDRLKKKPSDWVARHRLGITYQVRGQWMDALREYRYLTEKVRQKASWAWVGLGYTYMRMRNHSLAETAYRKAVELDPENALAHHDLGATLHQKGEWLAAIDEYKRTIEINPDDAMAHYNIGFNALERGKTDEGLHHLREAVRVEPGHEMALNALIPTLCQRREPGDVKEAVSLALEALRGDPEKAWTRTVTGFALGYQGGFESALAAYREIVTEPDADKDADFLNAFANARRRGHNDLEEAEAAYREGLDLKPNHLYLLQNFCAMILGQGRDDEAIALCLDALKADPTFVQAHNMLGYILLNRKEDRDKAVETWRLAFEFAPDYAPIRRNLLAVLYARKGPGDLERAREIARRVVETTPLDLSANQAYGNALGRQLDPEAAKAVYREKFPDMQPAQQAYFLHGLSVGLLQEGRLLASARMVAECLEVSPGTVAVDQRLGVLLARMVDLEGAEKAYRRWVPEASEERTARFLVGVGGGLSQIARGKYEQASEAYRRALGHFPENHPLQATTENYRIICLRSLGRAREALAVCQHLLDRNPKNLTAWFQIAYTHMGQRKYREAHAALQNAHSIQRENNWVFFHSGCAHYFMGRFLDAEHALHRAAGGMPFQTYVKMWHDMVHRLAKYEPRAVPILDGREKPENAAMAVDFARFCLFRGRPATALEYFEEAFRRNPEYDTMVTDLGVRHDRIRALVAAGIEAEKGLSALDPAEAPKFRAKALQRLRDDFVIFRDLAEEDLAQFWSGVLVSYWRYDHPAVWARDPFLIAVTDPKERDGWSEGEVKEWSAFFAEVDKFLAEMGKQQLNPRGEKPR